MSYINLIPINNVLAPLYDDEAVAADAVEAALEADRRGELDAHIGAKTDSEDAETSNCREAIQHPRRISGEI